MKSSYEGVMEQVVDQIDGWVWTQVEDPVDAIVRRVFFVPLRCCDHIWRSLAQGLIDET